MLSAQIPGLKTSSYFDEQVITFYYQPEIRVHINAPSIADFDPSKPTALALYALPNGNTIEQTVGKVLETGDDWHFDIQHIGAQTRFLRNHVDEYNLVTIYLEASQKSWPAWKAAHANHAEVIQNLVDYLMGVFNDYDPFLVLTGHSGGGRFTFSFLDGVSEIPASVKRISFLDSNYGYENFYGEKIVNWLNASEDHFLSVIAYNDSVALYNGAPIVSATGGTWYRSRMMKLYMNSFYTFTATEDDEFVRYTALEGRIKFILKQNPTQAILHTVQVERNGHIQGMVSGTPDEGVDYTYYGERAYTPLIQQNVTEPAMLTIPPRPADARTGSQFMQDVTNMSFAQREEQILNEISTGNIPEFMRNLTTISAQFQDANSNSHSVTYQVMPDYIAIGSDDDFCRIPTGPITAQKIADLFGAVMPTRKLVDNIYTNCVVKLAPVTYTPVGNQNELVPKFVQHNSAINTQFNSAGGELGELTGGTKKDVVLSNLIIDPNRPNHVCIYGWHQLNGLPIQPLTNIHIDTYTDYSHGIRYLNNEILIDGVVKKIDEVLSDPVLYKILSDESGLMSQPTYILNSALPDKPRSFGVIGNGSGKIEIKISQVAGATDFRLSYGTDPANLTESGDYTTGNITIDGLDDNLIYYFKLMAKNSAGNSPESEILAATPGANNGDKVLIVNGFDRGTTGNSYDFVIEHGNAIKNHGMSFESVTNDAVINGVVLLSDYPVVDYILGDESTVDETFSNAEQTIVKAYLESGGKLFVSGAELAWDLDWKGSSTDKNFINNYLKAKYVEDAPGNTSGTYYSITPVAGGIFGSMSPFAFDNGTHGTINVLWPDVLQGVNGGEANLLYTGFNAAYGCSGVQFSGNFPGGSVPGKVITMGVPFETIYPESVRNELMGSILNWFDISSGIREKSTIPIEYGLSQNYPNPFNPSTRIEYSITSEARVLLTVYNINGEKVATLVDGVKSPGRHFALFNASNLASGVYLYKIEVYENSGKNVFSSGNKMMLLK